MKKKQITLVFLLLVLMTLLSGCVPPPPNDASNICSIFEQYPKWYWAAQDSQKKWDVPISVMMAIMQQESGYNGKIKPPREKLLWIIPWKRPSSSVGYTQALSTTWDTYERSIGKKQSRKSFADSINFIGWVSYEAHVKDDISRTDAYDLYLAYHEGIGGYQQKTYLKKKWLMDVARKVNTRAGDYHAQLIRCESHLKKKPWYYYLF